MGETGLEDRRVWRKKDQTPRTELEAAQIEIERLKYQLYLAEMDRDLQRSPGVLTPMEKYNLYLAA